ncbi:restriction endonuclease subunit S [Aurantivibrio plasticivorans]
MSKLYPISIKGWDEVTLGNLIEVLTDYTANGSFEALKTNVTYYSEDNYAALVRTTDLEKSDFSPQRFTDKKGYEFQRKTALFGGEIVLANVGSVGKVYRVPVYCGRMTLAPNTYLVKFKSEYDEGFLFQFLLSEFYIAELYKNISSTTLAAINKDNFRSIRLLLPNSIQEQQKIAKILTTVDNLIEKTQALIDKYTAIKQGMMADLFTRGIDLTGTPETNPSYGQLRSPVEQAPELYKETELGWVPKGWEVVDFGEVVDVIDPNPSHRYPDASNDGIPLCSTENFYGENDYLFKNPKFVPLETFIEQHQRCRFAETDVVFARKGRIGLARRYGHESKAFSHTVVVIKSASKRIDEHWLVWISRSYRFLHFIENTMNTNLGVPTLGVDFIKKVPIPLPKIDEQRIVANRLDSITALINMQERENSKYRSIKNGLMQDLLTGKVKVN